MKYIIMMTMLLVSACSSTIRDVEVVELPPKVVVETVYEKCSIDLKLFEIIKSDIKDNITYNELNILLIEKIKEYESRLKVIKNNSCIKK